MGNKNPKNKSNEEQFVNLKCKKGVRSIIKLQCKEKILDYLNRNDIYKLTEINYKLFFQRARILEM